MELAGKKALVIGAGRSGTAAARFLAERGARVALNDRKPLEEWSAEARALESAGVKLFSGDVPQWMLDHADLLVVSPGVPTKSIAVRYAERAGVEIVGEVELAYRFLRGRLVAITGTNGKTTTTALVGQLLADAGFHVQVGGNIGTPLISLVETSRDNGWTVAEISSFQLETTDLFHPHVAAVLNVTPDHMDRYETFNDYAAAKHRIFRRQTEDDWAVLNADDETVSSWASGLCARVLWFSRRREVERGIFLRGRTLIARFDEGERELLAVDELSLRGAHNVENVMAALCMGRACGAPFETMCDTVRRFRGVEHRLELVAEIEGVRFYNDSKATNVDAAVKAFEAFSEDGGRIVAIMGGRGKGAPYAPLAPLIESRARALVLIGEDADRIARELGPFAPAVERAADMCDAVARAFRLAQPGDIVLLAPACASYDMFADFEDRGRKFKEAVRGLIGKESVGAR
jgi:UDP-N-acetylmuramoylalanine--D-glutamate ligase